MMHSNISATQIDVHGPEYKGSHRIIEAVLQNGRHRNFCSLFRYTLWETTEKLLEILGDFPTETVFLEDVAYGRFPQDYCFRIQYGILRRRHAVGNVWMWLIVH
jgi:hypothetical protein